MSHYKRPMCKSESPEDKSPQQQSGVKRQRSTHDTAELPRKPRPPTNEKEVQLLNRMDQLEFEKIIISLSVLPRMANKDFLARAKFWETFYAKESNDCPGGSYETLKLSASAIVRERRLSQPWYFQGLDKFTRQKFPPDWPYFYPDGEELNDRKDTAEEPDTQQQHTQAASSNDRKAAIEIAKTEIWTMNLDDMEASIELSKREIERVTSRRDEFASIITKTQDEVTALGEELTEIQWSLDMRKAMVDMRRVYDSRALQK